MTYIGEYLDGLVGDAREWTAYFVDYMRKKHPDIEELMYYGVPTFRPVAGDKLKFISFSAANAHLSMHTLDFDYIAQLQKRLKKPGKGKGCVNVPYQNTEERVLLEEAIEELVARMHG